MRRVLTARRTWLVLLVVLVIALPASVVGFRRARNAQRRAALSQFLMNPASWDADWIYLPAPDEEEEGGGPEEEDGDDARRRDIATRILWGLRTPEGSAELSRISTAELAKWSGVGRSASGPGTQAFTAQPWVNLGPTNATFQWNGTTYPQVDSGRLTGVEVHPADAQIVYVATAGGGIWKTSNFGVANPTWTPITEQTPNLAIGHMRMDPTAPDTLYAGLGDFVDTPGGQMIKTTNGGQSWSAPVQLSGTYPPAAGGLVATAQRIRMIEVDPQNPSIVLVGTEVGLFRSTNGGAGYSLIDLPNPNPAPSDPLRQRAEGVWTIQYLGHVAGVSRWIASGQPACFQGMRPPHRGYSVPAGAPIPGISPAPTCTYGNTGDLWISTDAGATWASQRAAGLLPAVVGRIALAAGTPDQSTNPPTTTVYAQNGPEDEGVLDGAGFWRTLNSGTSWTVIAPANGGTVTNRTNAVFGNRDCGDADILNQQPWYNQAIWVDPGDDNRFVAGGMLCGMRTLDGKAATPTFTLISHWLPSGGGGNTANGTLPYVHADWQRVFIVRVGGVARVFAGTDGGIFWSDTILTPVNPESTTWNFANRGIVTHLSYSVASGDPPDGNAIVAFTGLQDNGTRMRERGAGNTTVFNQVIGGDGFGAAASRNPANGSEVFWAGVNGQKRFCVPAAGNSFCNQAGAIFSTRQPPVVGGCANEGQPFITRYARVIPNPTPHTFITTTNRGVHRISGSPPAAAWTTISPCITAPDSSVVVTRNIAAHPLLDGVYGINTSGGRFGVTSNCQGAATACTWTISNRLFFDQNGDMVRQPPESLSFTSMIAFPPNPAGPAGNEYLGASSAPFMDDFSTLVPASIGHLFRTTDRGTTFTPFHGNGTGQDLPNVGIGVVRYDPADLTNQTIFVGTELGVYRTIDGGNTWQRYGIGLPNVWVTDMVIGRTGAILRIGTYGRGLWEIYPTATGEKGVSGNGDWDRNLQLDHVDLGAMASRLGTTPATVAAPLYDWNDDMTGTVNAIDEADLTTFLPRFGDRP